MSLSVDGLSLDFSRCKGRSEDGIWFSLGIYWGWFPGPAADTKIHGSSGLRFSTCGSASAPPVGDDLYRGTDLLKKKCM